MMHTPPPHVLLLDEIKLIDNNFVRNTPLVHYPAQAIPNDFVPEIRVRRTALAQGSGDRRTPGCGMTETAQKIFYLKPRFYRTELIFPIYFHNAFGRSLPTSVVCRRYLSR